MNEKGDEVLENRVRLKNINVFGKLLLVFIVMSAVFAGQIEVSQAADIGASITNITVDLTDAGGQKGTIIQPNKGGSLFFETDFTIDGTEQPLKAGDTFKIDLPDNTNVNGITDETVVSNDDIIPELFRGVMRKLPQHPIK